MKTFLFLAAAVGIVGTLYFASHHETGFRSYKTPRSVRLRRAMLERERFNRLLEAIKGDNSKSIAEAAKEVFEVSKEDYNAHLALARYYVGKKNWAQARAHLEAILDSQWFENSTAHGAEVIVLWMQCSQSLPQPTRDLRLAKWRQHAIQLPGSGYSNEAGGEALAEFLYGKALGNLGKHDNSLLHLRRATSLDPTFGAAWLQLGLELQKGRDIPGSRAAFSNAYRTARTTQERDDITASQRLVRPLP